MRSFTSFLSILSTLSISACVCKPSQTCQVEEDYQLRSLLQVSEKYKAVEEHVQPPANADKVKPAEVDDSGCNWLCYINRYEDLEELFGYNGVTQAAAHWKSHGRSEGRDCTCQAAYLTGRNEYCPSGWDVPDEEACANSAWQLGLWYEVAGDWYMGHKHCHFADDGRSKVYFNRNAYPNLGPPNKNFASICSCDAACWKARISAKHAPQQPITFITVYDPVFETGLASSSLWVNRLSLPHQWLVLNNTANESISKVYARGRYQAVNRLQVYLHPDVILQENFYHLLMKKLALLEATDSNWGVLGTAGVSSTTGKMATSIQDASGLKFTGIDNLPVQSLDEHLMVLRPSSPMWDTELPGFDLYGTDMVLSAKKAGQTSYLLNLPSVSHKVIAPDSKVHEAWLAKVRSPQYQQRLLRTVTYFQQKWCASGFLPIVAPVFDIDCHSFKSHV